MPTKKMLARLDEVFTEFEKKEAVVQPDVEDNSLPDLEDDPITAPPDLYVGLPANLNTPEEAPVLGPKLPPLRRLYPDPALEKESAPPMKGERPSQMWEVILIAGLTILIPTIIGVALLLNR